MRRNPLLACLKVLGPGLITGAADDDPSGIATYSQTGAQFGYQLAWTMVFSYPLMSVIQGISAHIGLVTGAGIAQNLRQHFPRWMLYLSVILLVVANVANLGADLGAMGAALELIIGGPALIYTICLALLSILLQIFLNYRTYCSMLKWLTLSLFSYVAVALAAHIPWHKALYRTFVPGLKINKDYAEALVAILGTTISPYLFFWQASQEVEEQQRHRLKPLKLLTLWRAGPQLGRMKADTWIGMGYSNLIAIFIIYATAATLNAKGITDIQTSAQAAEALRPIAGNFAFAIFACGIVGTGLLAIPTLAGSGAYAICEAFQRTEGLDRKFREAQTFYGTIAVSTLIGLALNFIRINPIKALYWSAVLNGILAAPLMAAMLLIARQRKIMGDLAISQPVAAMGWFATAVMAAASVIFLFF